MTTSFDRAELAAALTAVMPAVDTKAFNPALACVRISARQGAATVVATDLDLTIVRSLDAGGDDLDVVVGARNLNALVAKLTGETVELTVGDTLDLASGTVTASLNTVDAAEFPGVDTDPCDDEAQLSPDELAMLARLVPFASEDPQRPGLQGVVFDGTEAYATTSFHLGRATFDTPLPNMNIPARLLRAVLAAVEGDDLGVRLSFDGRRAVVSTETTTWATAVITAKAPQVAQLLDMYATPSTLATCDREELRKAIALTRTLPADPDLVRFSLDPDGLKVWRRERDVGEVANVVEAELTGTPVETFSFNPRFMADVLAGVTTDSITLGFFDGEGLKPMRVSDGDWTALLMPVRVSW